MINLLASLGEDKKKLEKTVGKLEQITGHAGEDLRLMHDIQRASAQKVQSLGLDPTDTTDEELHFMLLNKLDKDGAQLARALGLRDADSLNTTAGKLSEINAKINADTYVFALKPAVIKKMLRENPPKHLMKQLRYRSIDSLLKRENVAQIMAGASLLEPTIWHKCFAKSLSAIKAADFEERKIQFIAMDEARWSGAASPKHPVTESPLLGTIVVWPVPAIKSRKALFCLPLIAEAVSYVEADSDYLHKYQFSSEFQNLIKSLYEAGEYKQLDIEGHKLFDWLHLRSANNGSDNYLNKLAALHPLFHWWKNNGHLAQVTGKIVSMNLNDCIRSAIDDVSFEGRALDGWVNQVKSELAQRYARHLQGRDYMLKQFDDTFIELEPAYEPIFEIENQIT